MAYKPMWNFGGVRIAGVDGGADISFDTDEAMGQIEFDEVMQEVLLLITERYIKEHLVAGLILK